MIPKPLDSVRETDLSDLVANKVAEGKTLEYKLALPGTTDQEKVKFLRAVSSLANTAGGDLLYGVQAANGIPTSLPGLTGVNKDAERLRLENLCRDGLQERIKKLQFKFVALASGTSVLIIRTPKSWSGPHRVIIAGHGHFYGRNSAGTYQLDVPELRSSFLMTQTLADRIRAFREARLAQIMEKVTPVPLQDGAKLVFHVVPLEAFIEGSWARLQMTREEARAFTPPNLQGSSILNNFDGHAIYYGGDGAQMAYAQVFRSGVVEYVVVFNYTDQEGTVRFPAQWAEGDVIETASRFLRLLTEKGITPPFYLMLSVLGVRDHAFDSGSWMDQLEKKKTGRDTLISPEVAVDNVPFDAPVALKPIFDMLWNAFGYEHSRSYDAQGNYSPKKGR